MTRTTGTTSAGITPVQLPADLAPSLAERLPATFHGRLHRSGRHDVVVTARRRSRYAC
jgi:hypothetical protein